MTGLKLGLNVQKKGQQLAKSKAVFLADDDSEEERPAPPKKSNLTAPKRTDFRKKIEKEEIDPSIYDYDAAYDAIHAKTSAKNAAAREHAEQRNPKYVEGLLASAEVRKRDQLRARDKMLQKEREAEGEEFADKEKFVTSAYKEQQEELRRLEVEEKIKEESEAQKRRESGMQGFYRTMMDRDEQRHQEAVEAAANASKPSEIGEPVRDINDKTEKSEADIARDLNAKGARIILNEEGQVADKRQLLSAGLNVAPKPKSATTAGSQTGRGQYSRAPATSFGRNDNRKGVRERQSQMLEEQLEQATKRAADEEAEERRKQEHAAKSRKTTSDVSSAKERYLQRKREAAAAAAASNGTKT
ncbi:hypothetical protein P152DRAFT_169904 [Eremomyces bilateralis CBS 781.70]|uniref:Nuclear speckle splicing regulatory protein 1 N-terminal domain-containing protein n=1 Tax=Eremomyces bilateralis CBS 781.70 TaxID=1392243 RepID=A0A6G1FTB2_9PEZI|nr:uncharacterized protein P152DRAFT_169904 [Eremomyces bilateralis CBS 781.70]KAF1809115.1 hypothetical protein P152DRAFT_169904 [Eremomyces bilateralis CBS 781.70]